MQKYFLFNTVFIFSLLYRIKYIHPPGVFFPRCKFFLASALPICYTEMAERVFPVSCILFPVHAQMLFLCAGSSHNLPFHFRSAVFLLPVSLLLPHKFLKWRCILSPLCGKSARFGRLFAFFNNPCPFPRFMLYFFLARRLFFL